MGIDGSAGGGGFITSVMCHRSIKRYLVCELEQSAAVPGSEHSQGRVQLGRARLLWSRTLIWEVNLGVWVVSMEPLAAASRGDLMFYANVSETRPVKCDVVARMC